MPLSADSTAIAETYARIREEVGPTVTVVAATKYVSVDELALLAEAGVEVVGENRLQDLAAKHERYGDTFRWHFIGHLQSRKARDVSDLCELCHSLASESAARRLAVPALVEVNLSGEESKSGVAPESLGAFLAEVRELGVDDARPDDDAAARGRPGGLAAVFPPGSASSRRSTTFASFPWGRPRTTASPRRKARPWFGWDPCLYGR